MFRAEAIPVLVLMPMTLLFGPRRNYRVVAALYTIGIGSSALLAMVWSGLQAGADWMPAQNNIGYADRAITVPVSHFYKYQDDAKQVLHRYSDISD